MTTPTKTKPAKPKKRILSIAWTSDDGPTEHTDKMLDIFTNTVKNKPIPVTWFIQWNNLVYPVEQLNCKTCSIL